MSKKYLPQRMLLVLILSIWTMSAKAQVFEGVSTSFTGINFGTMTWGDYNKDGLLDLMIVGWAPGTGGTSNPTAELHKNMGNGTFQLVENTGIVPVGAGASAWADINNNGFLDLIVAGNPGPTTTLYRNNGDNTFTALAQSFAGMSSPSFAWADFDRDGYLDLLMTGNLASSNPFVGLYKNNGDETFTLMSFGLPQLSTSAINWMDFNNDGYPDIVMAGRIASSNYVVKLFVNNQGQGFTEFVYPFVTARYPSIAVGDLNNNGYDDLIVMGENVDGVNKTTVYANLLGAGFNTLDSLMTGIVNVSRGMVSIGDFDNDGLRDVVISGFSIVPGGGNTTHVYKNMGSFSFSQLLNEPITQVGRSSVRWGDYNNDGKLDLAMAGFIGSGNSISVLYKNNTPIANVNPMPPTALNSQVVGSKAILSWEAGVDIETPVSTLQYNVRIGSSPGAQDILSPMANPANGFRIVPESGNARYALNLEINGLGLGTYYWSVQTIDGAFAGSEFAAEQSFEISSLTNATFTVSSQGEPIENAAVTVGTTTRYTNESGVVVLNLNDGTYNYSVSKYAFYPASGSFTISGESVAVPVELIPIPAYTVSFQISNGENPLPNAQVIIGSQVYDANDEGFVEIELLIGDYDYTVTAPEHNEVNGSFSLIDQNLDFEIELVPFSIYQIPFSQDFNGGVLPIDWQNIDNSGQGFKWSFAGNKAVVDSDGAGTGKRVAATLISPVINCEDNGGVINLVFKQFYYHGGNSFAKIQVTNNGTDWVDVAHYTSNMGNEDLLLTTIDITNWAANQAYVRFRWVYDDQNTWAEKWIIDDVMLVEVLYEVKLSNPTKIEYGKIPLRQAGEMHFKADATNMGGEELTGVTLKVNVNDIPELSSLPVSLQTYETQPLVSSSPYNFSTPGTYAIELRIEMDQEDEDPSNNSHLLSFEVSDTVYATDRGPIQGAVGSNLPVSFGNLYQIKQTDLLRSFTIGWFTLTNYVDFTVSLFEVNMADSTIAGEVFTSDTIRRIPSMSNTYHTWLLETPLELQPAYYLLTVNQLTNDNIRIGYDKVVSGAFWRIITQNEIQKMDKIANPSFGNIVLRMNTHDFNTQLSEFAENQNAVLYPNPTRDGFYVQTQSDETWLISIYDVMGNLVVQEQMSSPLKFFSTEKLSSGTYLLHARSGKNWFTKRVVVLK